VIEETCNTFGFVLYDIEYSPDALRVYIDSLTPQEGVTIDGCARVSEALSLKLDLLDLIPHPYTLEVSSPGIERKLKKREHFQKALGQTIEVKLQFPKGDLKGVLTGKLVDADDEKIVIKSFVRETEDLVVIKYSEIKGANVKVSTEELFSHHRNFGNRKQRIMRRNE